MLNQIKNLEEQIETLKYALDNFTKDKTLKWYETAYGRELIDIISMIEDGIKTREHTIKMLRMQD